MNNLDKARDKMIMGAEKRTLVMSRDDLLMTAYHEAGHAIVGRIVPDHDPVYKVSIMPRGGALGITMFLPERDQYSANKDKLEGQISSLFGGRVAEALIYGKNKVTTGASNDIERATQLARNMVTKWGLSDRLGPWITAIAKAAIWGRKPSRCPRKWRKSSTRKFVMSSIPTINAPSKS